MDSLVPLCARHVITQRPLPTLPANLYPSFIQSAFLGGRPLAVQDLVAAWPFPELNFQRLLGHRELRWDRTCITCLQAIIQGVVAQLQRVLEDPDCHYSLRVLDITGLPDSMSSHTLMTGFAVWCTTRALASACMEVSKHQRDLQRGKSKRHKGRSRATEDTAVLQPSGVDIHADLVVDRWSYGILRKAFQAAATGPLRLKCRVLKAEDILASEIVTLLESLDRSCLQSVDLRFNNSGLTGLSETMPQLLPFPELHSFKLQYTNVDVQRPTPELATGFRRLVGPQGVLPSLQELSLGSSQLSGKLHQLLCDLQAPLESLELAASSLFLTNLAFLSQSIHAPVLKRLDLKGLDISQDLLEPLQLLLEESSSSLLRLDLRDCRMTDYHLAELLPTLLCCSRLRFLGLHDNHLSTVALKDLLQKIVELPDLHLVVFPFPVDCYTLDRLESDFYFVTDEELLAAATAEFSQILATSRRTDLDWTYDPDGHDAVV